MPTLVVPITEYFTLTDFGLNPRSRHRPPDYTPFKKLCTDLNQLLQQLLDEGYPYPESQEKDWCWIDGKEWVLLKYCNILDFTESSIKDSHYTKNRLFELGIYSHYYKPAKRKWDTRNHTNFLSLEMMCEGAWVHDFGRHLRLYLHYLYYNSAPSK
jgi:hypothetical protein